MIRFTKGEAEEAINKEKIALARHPGIRQTKVFLAAAIIRAARDKVAFTKRTDVDSAVLLGDILDIVNDVITT